MLRKSCSILFLLLCYGTPISAHDAFYPHHREDFENIARRRELRTTVLLSTVVFLCVLGAVVYVALRKSTGDSDVDKVEAETVQEHLARATNRAVRAAKQSLDTKGNIAEAATVCFTTYADMLGVTWRPPAYGQRHPESVPYQIRCKIGSDVVTLSIHDEVVRLKAERTSSKMGGSSQETSKSVSATVVLRRLSDGGE